MYRKVLHPPRFQLEEQKIPFRKFFPALLVLAGATTTIQTSAADNRDDWPTTAGDGNGSYHSPLTDINTTTVSRLGFAWDAALHTHRGQEATPVEVNGVLYGVGNFGRLYAVDGGTGKELWTYDPAADGQYGRYACCDVVNRGVAIKNGILYLESLDGYLHAIDAGSGRLLWKVDTFPGRGSRLPYTSTGVPVIAGDLVLIGSGGGDFKGTRGYVAAFDAQSGALRWRFYTVPRNPALGQQDQPALMAAVKTWDPRHQWENGGGGTVWDGISYDPALDLIYIGTGNASPYNIKEDGRTGGDDLYTDCIIALHAKTGDMAWHFQVVPGDMWDFDSTQKFIFADLPAKNGPRPVVMQASKNGFFYVLDRRTGEFISARPFASQNWTKGLNPKTGRPIVSEAVDYSTSPKLVFPWVGGAHSWQPMSFDARSMSVFIPAQEWSEIMLDTSHRKAGMVEGEFNTNFITPDGYDPAALKSLYGSLPPLKALAKGVTLQGRRGFIRAWDPVHQRLRWETQTASGWDGGLLSTDGGLVFQGDVNGMLNVYASATGTLLKSVAVGTSIMAAPMTYRIHGVQYIAVMAGYGGGDLGVLFPDKSAALRYGNDNRIIALRLDGPAPPLPAERASLTPVAPPASMGSKEDISEGSVLFNRFCARCHVFGVGILPDLRRLTPAKHEIFSAIVRQGVLSGAGMGRFDDVLSEKEVQEIHAYLIDEARNDYRDKSTPK